MSGKQKLVVIVGPTASGKSELAVRLAKKFNGEVISADSRQIYRGLDVGTGKIKGEWRMVHGIWRYTYKSIPHYCIDFVNPKKIFTVAEYKECAKKTIGDIINRGKIPFLVGGTGFWVDAVVHDIDFPRVSPNQKLRRKLEKKNTKELLNILRKLDPRRAKTIEQKNPRRLIRAIEIVRSLGRVPKIKKGTPYMALWLGISIPKVELREKIHARILQWIRKGLMTEVQYLAKKKIGKKRIRELGFDYRFLMDYRRKGTSRKEAIEHMEKGLNDYARRQMTWTKRNRAIQWVRKPKEAEQLTRRFLSLGGRIPT